MNKIHLGISKPCSENWADFASTDRGRFCQLCQKTVLDFRGLTPTELTAFFTGNKSKICGRFRQEQLTTYIVEPPKISIGFRSLKAGIVGLILLLNFPIQAQQNNETPTKTELKHYQNQEPKPNSDNSISIHGIVRDVDGMTQAGINVHLHGTDIGTFTDAEGKFKFPNLLKPGDKLVFSFIGFVTKDYVVPETQPQELQIEIQFDEMELMGEVMVVEESTKSSFFKRLFSKGKNVY